MTKFIPTCLVCNKEFYSRTGLTLHLDQGHTKEELIQAIKKWGVYVN